MESIYVVFLSRTVFTYLLSFKATKILRIPEYQMLSLTTVRILRH